MKAYIDYLLYASPEPPFAVPRLFRRFVWPTKWLCGGSEGGDSRGLLVTPGADYGDWVAPINSSGHATADGGPSEHVGLLLSTAQLIEDLELFVEGAAALGYGEPSRYHRHLACILPRVPAISMRTGDVAANYSAHRASLLRSFRAAFYNASLGRFEDTCRCVLAAPTFLDIARSS